MPKSRQPEYKTAGYLIPDVIDPDECICVCVPIPNDERHIQAFKAQLFALSRWWTWERDDLKRGKDAAAVWAGIYECVEARMDNNCGCGGSTAPEPMIRFAPDGTLEASYDGGQTWQPAPELDPRLTSSQFPPMPGADGDAKRCNAAWAAAKVIEDDIVGKLATADASISLVAVIAGILAIYLSGGALTPLVVALVGAAMQAGEAAIIAAFTAEVWEDFRCILYCNMTDSATISEAQWQQIKSDIDGTFTGIAKTLLYGTVDAFGAVGLTNAARSNRASGTGCDTCPCETVWCFRWDFTASNGGWTADPSVGASYASGQGWKTGASQGVLYIKKTIPMTANITSVRVKASTGAAAGGVGTRAPLPFNNSGAGSTDATFLMNVDVSELGIGFDSNFSSGTNPVYSGAITEVIISGTGDNPFGVDNCEE